jgi:fructose-1,6-bisphosphatase/inositol monophosphatase family enzyme
MNSLQSDFDLSSKFVARLIGKLPERERGDPKPDGTRVTQWDKYYNSELDRHLKERYPGFIRILEESNPDLSFRGFAKDGQDTGWGDPIDGSALHEKGVNVFGTALALYSKSSQPLLGCFFQKRARYSFINDERGLRAYVDRRELPHKEVKVDNLKDAYIWISSDAHRTVRLEKWIGKVRAFGSTSYHIAAAAEDVAGDPLAVVLTRYKRYDLAATMPVAQAAGCELFDLRTRHKIEFADYYVQADDNQPLLLAAARYGQVIFQMIETRPLSS